MNNKKDDIQITDNNGCDINNPRDKGGRYLSKNKKCLKCGTKIKEGQYFCAKCGTSVSCHVCGAPMSGGFVCEYCGAKRELYESEADMNITDEELTAVSEAQEHVLGVSSPVIKEQPQAVNAPPLQQQEQPVFEQYVQPPAKHIGQDFPFDEITPIAEPIGASRPAGGGGAAAYVPAYSGGHDIAIDKKTFKQRMARLSPFGLAAIFVGFLILLFVLDIAGAVFGGGGSGDLTVWAAEGDVFMIEYMLDRFNEENGSSYNFVVDPVGEDIAATELMRDPGAAADVFSFASDQLGTLVDQGVILPITYAPALRLIENSIQQAQFSSRRYGTGVPQAIPYTYENTFLFYNSSLLNENDVVSMAGLIAAGSRLPGTVDHVLALNMEDAYYSSMFYFTFGIQLFGPEGIDANDINFANERGLAASRYISYLGGRRIGGRQAVGNIGEEMQAALLAEGRVAAVISGPHNIEAFRLALGPNYAVAMLPTINTGQFLPALAGENRLISFAGTKLYGVNAETASRGNTQLAMRVAYFLSSPQNQIIRMQEREFLPTYRSLFDEARLSGRPGITVVYEQSYYAVLKPAIPRMSNYWINMGGFTRDFFNNAVAEAQFMQRLQLLESQIRGIEF